MLNAAGHVEYGRTGDEPSHVPGYRGEGVRRALLRRLHQPVSHSPNPRLPVRDTGVPPRGDDGFQRLVGLCIDECGSFIYTRDIDSGSDGGA